MNLKNITQTGFTWLWFAILIIGLDRASKIWVFNHLSYFEPVKILPIFNLTLAYNNGAAFSFLKSASGWSNILFGGLAIIVSIIVIIWLTKIPGRSRWLSIALCLVLGGALGNAWDR